ncbi:hypothetical protein ABPG77_007008 [Micractinium sp. CCAP 211/92]
MFSPCQARRSGAAALTALVWLLAGGVDAVLPLDCTDPTRWTQLQGSITGGALAPLSACQASALRVVGSSVFDLGGLGNVGINLITFPAFSAGCTEPDTCMQWCQSLCCLAKGCRLAQVKYDVQLDNFIGFMDSTSKWTCWLYGSGSYVPDASNNYTTCSMSSSANCRATVKASFPMNDTVYNWLTTTAANTASCPVPKYRVTTGIPNPTRLNNLIQNFPVNHAAIAKVLRARGLAANCQSVVFLGQQFCPDYMPACGR